MRGVEIRDGIERSGFLAFDLAEILDALGSLTATSTWRCRDLWVTGREDLEVRALEAASESPEGISMTTDELAGFAAQVAQVIDGEFSAIVPGETEPWLVIRAVDSSWWEVFSANGRVFDALRLRFTDLRDVGEVPQN